MFNGKEHKISQYADDTTLVLDGSSESLFAALDTIDLFSTFSGLQINSSKTKIVWIGSNFFSKQVYHHTRWKLEWGCTKFNLLGIEFSVELEKNVSLNYSVQIPKIKALIQQWKRRILTPFGRVTVVKTLLLPKLNHLFISLPSPDKEIISSLTNLFYEFIWNSKIDKVKRQPITQDYLKGGIKMLDINNFLVSLKCSWIKRLTKDNKPWTDIFLDIHGNKVVKHLLDFGDKYVQNIINHSNNFWKDVLHSWLKVLRTIDYSLSTTNVCAMPIWFNTNICVGNKPIIVYNWYEHGIKTIGDFLNEDGQFLKQHDFAQNYRLSNVCTMLYNSVINAISSFLRSQSIKRSDVRKYYYPYIPFYFEYVLLFEKCSKILYNLINSKDIIPSSIQKWNTELSMQLEINVSVKEFFKVCFKTSADTSVQWLQYRILFRMLPTKYYLKKINVSTDDCCSFCKEDVETIQHVFIKCLEILPLWNKLSMHIYCKTTNRIGFNVNNVMFGEIPLNQGNKVVNFIILYTKQYIFNCLKQKKIPHLKGLLQHIYFKYKVERYISIKSCEMLKFDKQWSNWKNIFEI